MNEQIIEQKLQEQLKDFAEKIKGVAEEAVTNAYCGLLPYTLDDTVSNAGIQATDMINDLLGGQFEWDGDYITLTAREFSPRIRVAFTQSKYDAIRDALIERMPKCPKDDKIAALEGELKRAYERPRYY